MTIFKSLSSGDGEIWTIRGFKTLSAIKDIIPIQSGIPIVSSGYLSSYNSKVEEYANMLLDDGIHPYVFIHSIYRASHNDIADAIDISKSVKIPIFIHFMETEKEYEIIRNHGYDSPIDFLDGYGFPRKTYLVHFINMTKEEILEASKRYYLVTCPLSNINFLGEYHQLILISLNIF